jgi:thiol-disulfide isomerase/thioredoxin
MRAILLAILFALFGLNSNAQIRSWKITDLEKYIQTTDSPLIVNFWATFCVPCKEEIPYFEAITRKYAKNKVKLLLVSLDLKKDYPEKIMEYMHTEKITAEVVWLDETDADYFIPRIDSSWTGALPATLLSSKGIAKPLFYDRQLKPEELEKAIRKILHPDESSHSK